MSSQGNNSAAKWLGLLRWSMTHSDGTTPSSFQKMSKDDREWLEQVMKENVRNEPERMNEIMLKVKEILAALSSDSIISSSELLPSLLENIEYDLEDLRDIVEQVDMALVFAKCGGCDVLLSFLETSHNFAGITVEMKALTASILATITQNHLKAQDLLIKGGMIDKLAGLFLSSCNSSLTSSSLLPTKLLFALSCLIRGHPTGEELFMLRFADLVFSQALLLPGSSSSRTELTNPVVSRALFLANALIVSDYCTNSRVAKLALLFIPFCLDFLTSISDSSSSSTSAYTSRDAQDNVFLLLSSLLRTSAGYAMIQDRSPYSETLSTWFVLKEKQQSNNDYSSEGEEEEEKEMKEHLRQQFDDLKRLFSSPLEVFYPTKEAEENSKKAVDELRSHQSGIRVGSTVSVRENVDSNVGNDQTADMEDAPPVLLIEPPPLEASSVAP
jgi:hypothetical protein